MGFRSEQNQRRMIRPFQAEGRKQRRIIQQQTQQAQPDQKKQRLHQKHPHDGLQIGTKPAPYDSTVPSRRPKTAAHNSAANSAGTTRSEETAFAPKASARCASDRNKASAV